MSALEQAVPLCGLCGQEKLDGVGCTPSTFSDYPDEVVRERVRRGEAQDSDLMLRLYNGPEELPEFCPDCRAPIGALHHDWCRYEACSECGWQVFSHQCGEALEVD